MSFSFRSSTNANIPSEKSTADSKDTLGIIKSQNRRRSSRTKSFENSVPMSVIVENVDEEINKINKSEEVMEGSSKDLKVHEKLVGQKQNTKDMKQDEEESEKYTKDRDTSSSNHVENTSTKAENDEKDSDSTTREQNEESSQHEETSQRQSPLIGNEKLLAKYMNYCNRRKLKLDVNEISNHVRKIMKSKQERQNPREYSESSNGSNSESKQTDDTKQQDEVNGKTANKPKINDTHDLNESTAPCSEKQNHGIREEMVDNKSSGDAEIAFESTDSNENTVCSKSTHGSNISSKRGTTRRKSRDQLTKTETVKPAMILHSSMSADSSEMGSKTQTHFNGDEQESPENIEKGNVSDDDNDGTNSNEQTIFNGIIEKLNTSESQVMAEESTSLDQQYEHNHTMSYSNVGSSSILYHRTNDTLSQNVEDQSTSQCIGESSMNCFQNTLQATGQSSTTDSFQGFNTDSANAFQNTSQCITSDLSESALNDLVQELFFKESQALLLHVNLMQCLSFNKNHQRAPSYQDLTKAVRIMAEVYNMRLNQFVLLRNPQIVFTARLIAT